MQNFGLKGEGVGANEVQNFGLKGEGEGVNEVQHFGCNKWTEK